MTVGDVYRALWRYGALILALTAACVVTTWYVASQQTKTYEAATLLRLQYPSTADPGSELEALEAGERLALAYANVIESGALDRRVAAAVPRLSGPGASSVELSASEVEGLEMLRVAAQSSDPATAAVAANAVPQALRELVRDTEASRGSIVVLRAATLPTSPVAPRIGLTIVLAALLALIFNSALALFLEVFRDRLPEPDELEQLAGQPILATVPALRLRRLATDDLKASSQGDGVLTGPPGDRHAAPRDRRSDR